MKDTRSFHFVHQQLCIAQFLHQYAFECNNFGQSFVCNYLRQFTKPISNFTIFFNFLVSNGDYITLRFFEVSYNIMCYRYWYVSYLVLLYNCGNIINLNVITMVREVDMEQQTILFLYLIYEIAFKMTILNITYIILMWSSLLFYLIFLHSMAQTV